LVMVLGLLVCLPEVGNSEPMGTAFTYQGRLIDGNDAADGFYDLQFKLYSDPCVGPVLAGPVNEPNLDVIEGYFTVELDFSDPNIFKGDARWLEIGVRPGDMNDPNEYTVLEPRQELTPTPYAMYAQKTGALETSGDLVLTSGSGIVEVGTLYEATDLVVNGMVQVRAASDFLGGDVSALSLGVYPTEFVGASIIDSNDPCNPYDSNDSNGWAGLLTGAEQNLCLHSGSGTIYMGAPYEAGKVRNYGAFYTDQLGVGTTEPGYELDVKGDIHASGAIGAGAGTLWMNNVPDAITSTSGKIYLGNDSPGDFEDVKVGIGTTNPVGKLHVNGNIHVQQGSRYCFLHQNPHTAMGLDINNDVGGSSGNDLQIQAYGATDDSFQIISLHGTYPFTSNCRLQVNLDNGNVGIGTTTPARKLHVNDVIRLEPRSDFPGDGSNGDLCVVGDSNDRHIYCYLNGDWKQLDPD